MEITSRKANQIIKELKKLVAIIGNKGKSFLSSTNINETHYPQNLALNGDL